MPHSQPARNRPTLKDIGRLCGVSHAAVSAVLTGARGNVVVSSATREKILQTARELSYQPHRGARGMRNNRFDAAGFFYDHIFPDSSIHNIIEGALSNAVVASGRQVILVRPRHELAADRQYLEDLIRSQCVDVFIAMSVLTHSIDLPGIFDGLGIPCIHLNRKGQTNCIYVDDLRGGEIVTQHVLDRGYRNVLYLQYGGESARHYSIADRQQGYITAMKSRNLAPLTAELAHDERGPGEQQAQFAALMERYRPDAVIANGDALAVRIQRYILASGLMPGRDIAVTGYNDGSVASYSPVRLTTMRVPWSDMALGAAEMALSLIGKNLSLQTIDARVHQPELVIRDSTPPRKTGT